MHAKRSGFVVQPQYGLNDMRVGLERANSCHDHDGFQANPHQFLGGTSTSMIQRQIRSRDSNSKEKN